MTGTSPKAILIAGPTASGKSSFALDLARTRDGVIVNADSMQVYAELSVLTARPTAEDEAAVPHRLYGHIRARDPYSVARWQADVGAVVSRIASSGQLPIIVGGTGLYFKALTEGLSPVPAIPDDVRQQWRDAAEAAGPGELHAILAAKDPVMAERLAPGDTQRITRALEVISASGRSLAVWQTTPGTPLVKTDEAECLVVDRPREELHRRADQRFDLMLAEGAIEEVELLRSQNLSPTLPAMRALGVAPLMAMIAGHISRKDAADQGKLETRQYIKRQQTWLKRNMSTWKAINK
ncbi:MAG: tRNA (adenosine(37)-N6)-dimethylallyltransferase MiaA [Hyphomicrobiaceae bacterium]